MFEFDVVVDDDDDDDDDDDEKGNLPPATGTKTTKVLLLGISNLGIAGMQ